MLFSPPWKAFVADAWFPPATECVIHLIMYLILYGQRCRVRWELNCRLSEGAEGEIPTVIYKKKKGTPFLLQLWLKASSPCHTYDYACCHWGECVCVCDRSVHHSAVKLDNSNNSFISPERNYLPRCRSLLEASRFMQKPCMSTWD